MGFVYQDERFADLQLLRYRLNGFDELSLRQKKLIYYLSKATLFGRDITFDQYGKYNLRIRKMLEVIYCDETIAHDTAGVGGVSEACLVFEWYLPSLWLREVQTRLFRRLPAERSPKGGCQETAVEIGRERGGDV